MRTIDRIRRLVGHRPYLLMMVLYAGELELVLAKGELRDYAPSALELLKGRPELTRRDEPPHGGL